MELLLSGRTALVTGATSGLGRAIALGLAAEGVRMSCDAAGFKRIEGYELPAKPTDVLLVAFEGRIVNFHPSILPAAPGRDGFGDTVRFGARFIGSTVHLVDSGMDTGRPLLQASWPNDPNQPIAERRHRVFVQQCKSLIQIVRWFEEGRVECDGAELRVSGARFDHSEFSPNLDFEVAIDFDIPFKGAGRETGHCGGSGCDG